MRRLMCIFLFLIFSLIWHTQEQLAIQGLSPYFETGRRVIVMPSSITSGGTRGYSVNTLKVVMSTLKHRRPFVTLSSTTKFASNQNDCFNLLAEVVVKSTTRFNIRLTVKSQTDGIRSWSLSSTIKFDYVAFSRTLPNFFISNTLDVIKGNSEPYPKTFGQKDTHKIDNWVGISSPFDLRGVAVRFVWGIIYTHTDSDSKDNKFGMHLEIKPRLFGEFQTILNSNYDLKIRQYKISLFIYDRTLFEVNKINLKDMQRAFPPFAVNDINQTLTWDGWYNFPGMQFLTGLSGFYFKTAPYFAFQSNIKFSAPTVQITHYIENLAPTIAIPQINITYLTVSQLTCPSNQPLLDFSQTVCVTICPPSTKPSPTPLGLTGLYFCVSCSGLSCCTTGTYWNGIQCLSCIENCTMCSNDTNCVACATGYIRDENGVCIEIPSCELPCTGCNGLLCTACAAPFQVGGGNCICPDDMLLVNGVCELCSLSIANCLSCDSNTVCNECSLTYYLTSTFSCQRCVAGCDVCINNSECIECSLLATLNDENKRCECNDGSYMDTTIQDCVPCSLGCLICTATACTSCSDTDQIASGTQCVCPSSYYTNSLGSCDLCTSLVSDCLSCDSTGCLSCNPNFYTSTDRLSCIPCPHPCSTCNSGTQCTSCEATYQLDTTGSCSCEVGTFLNSTTNNCQTCTLANCEQCLSLTQCDVCSAGYFWSPTMNYCQLCTDEYGITCSACTDTQCTECIPPMTFNSSGVCSCPLGQVYSSGACQMCSLHLSQCQTCNSIVECTNCNPGFYLQNPTTCSPCPSDCMKCTANLCSQCYPSFIQNASGNCICPLGSYNNGAQTCLSCNSAILGCAECSSSSICDLCSPAFFQAIGTTTCQACTPNCVHCDDSGCLTCFNGFIQTEDPTTTKTICQDCKILFGSSCTTCDVLMCTLCAVDSFWNPSSNQCVSLDLLECSDGIWIEQLEACDDGNSLNGDGCSSECQIQADYECRPQDKLLTGESLCVFTKEISIVFDRLQKEPSSNVVSLILKAQPSTFMQWNAQQIKSLLEPIEIVNQQTGVVSVIPLNSVNVIFTRNEETNQIQVVIDYGQNSLEGSYFKFNLDPSATNLSALKYISIQNNLLLPIDNSKTGVYLYGYSEEMYATQDMISNICTGIGFIALVFAFLGMFFPTGKIIIIQALVVVQISYFSILQYKRIPPTYIGFKALMLSNGYNDQGIVPQTSQEHQNIYKLMGINVNALSNYNIALILFVVMPALIGGIGLIAIRLLSKKTNASIQKQQLRTNQTTIQDKDQEEPNQTDYKDSLKQSKVQSIIDKLNSSRLNSLHSPAFKNSPDKLHKVTMDQNLIANKDNTDMSNQNPQSQNTSFSKLILQRILYENTFYGLFITSYLAWVSMFYSSNNFQIPSISVILIQVSFLTCFGIVFVRQNSHKINLNSLLAKVNKDKVKQKSNDKRFSVSTKFGQFNELCMQRLQNPCDPTLKIYSKLSLVFLAERLISSLCLVILTQSMAFTSAIIVVIYAGLLVTIILINKKLKSIEEQKNKKQKEQTQTQTEKKQKVFVQIVDNPSSKNKNKSSVLDFFYQNYIFRQGINFTTIIIIQLLFLFVNITMTSQDPYETYTNNQIVTKFIPLIILGLMALNMLFNLFLFFVEIKQSLLLTKIKKIIGHYFPSSKFQSELAQSNEGDEKNNLKEQDEKLSLESGKSRPQKEQEQVVEMLNKFLQKSEMLQKKQSPFIGIEEKQVKVQALKNMFKIEQAHKVKMSDAGKQIRSKLITEIWDQI